jgi:hypothetical protein
MFNYSKDFKEKHLYKALKEHSKLKGEKDIKEKEDKLNSLIEDLIDPSSENAIVNINVGGTKFATRKKTLLNVEDNLFYKLIKSNKLDLTKEIFIDRSPVLFPYIIDYLRYKKFDLKDLKPDQFDDLKEEVIYYELLNLENLFENIKNAEIVKVEVNSFYYENSTLVGSTDYKVLSSNDLTTGICTISPGMMILELNRPILINRMKIGGYIGNGNWINSNGYGAGGIISTSFDKIKWENVGTIPNGFGTQIIKTNLIETTAKYIKFETSDWLGIGYVKVYYKNN